MSKKPTVSMVLPSSGKIKCTSSNASLQCTNQRTVAGTEVTFSFSYGQTSEDKPPLAHTLLLLQAPRSVRQAAGTASTQGCPAGAGQSTTEPLL